MTYYTQRLIFSRTLLQQIPRILFYDDSMNTGRLYLIGPSHDEYNTLVYCKNGGIR